MARRNVDEKTLCYAAPAPPKKFQRLKRINPITKNEWKIEKFCVGKCDSGDTWYLYLVTGDPPDATVSPEIRYLEGYKAKAYHFEPYHAESKTGDAELKTGDIAKNCFFVSKKNKVHGKVLDANRNIIASSDARPNAAHAPAQNTIASSDTISCGQNVARAPARNRKVSSSSSSSSESLEKTERSSRSGSSAHASHTNDTNLVPTSPTEIADESKTEDHFYMPSHSIYHGENALSRDASSSVSSFPLSDIDHSRRCSEVGALPIDLPILEDDEALQRERVAPFEDFPSGNNDMQDVLNMNSLHMRATVDSLHDMQALNMDPLHDMQVLNMDPLPDLQALNMALPDLQDWMQVERLHLGSDCSSPGLDIGTFENRQPSSSKRRRSFDQTSAAEQASVTSTTKSPSHDKKIKRKEPEHMPTRTSSQSVNGHNRVETPPPSKTAAKEEDLSSWRVLRDCVLSLWSSIRRALAAKKNANEDEVESQAPAESQAEADDGSENSVSESLPELSEYY